MVSNKAKGNKKEKEVMEILQGKGYRCERVRNAPFHHGDMFGCADILALNNRHMKFVAVTDKKHKSRSVNRLKSLGKLPKFIVREAWIYGKNPGEWEVTNVKTD